MNLWLWPTGKDGWFESHKDFWLVIKKHPPGSLSAAHCSCVLEHFTGGLNAQSEIFLDGSCQGKSRIKETKRLFFFCFALRDKTWQEEGECEHNLLAITSELFPALLPTPWPSDSWHFLQHLLTPFPNSWVSKKYLDEHSKHQCYSILGSRPHVRSPGIQIGSLEIAGNT